MYATLAVAAILAALAIACDSRPGTRLSAFTRAEVVHVRACDYVVVWGGYGVGMVHAGDCPNPAHNSPADPSQKGVMRSQTPEAANR
jgi:hypothetical protein